MECEHYAMYFVHSIGTKLKTLEKIWASDASIDFVFARSTHSTIRDTILKYTQ